MLGHGKGTLGEKVQALPLFYVSSRGRDGKSAVQVGGGLSLQAKYQTSRQVHALICTYAYM